MTEILFYATLYTLGGISTALMIRFVDIEFFDHKHGPMQLGEWLLTLIWWPAIIAVLALARIAEGIAWIMHRIGPAINAFFSVRF